MAAVDGAGWAALAEALSPEGQTARGGGRQLLGGKSTGPHDRRTL